ncbi:MAG: 6-pyruvoyl trahydropterin synthase family protein [Verrucomicrobiota bacterium]
MRVTAEGEKLNELGLLVDFTILKGRLRELVERFDHENLNQIPPFDILNPSTENTLRVCSRSRSSASSRLWV